MKMFTLIVLFAVNAMAQGFYQAPNIWPAEVKERGTGQLLYNYKRTYTGTPENGTALREFSDLSGAIVARETLTYLGGRVTKYQYEQMQVNEQGTVTVDVTAKKVKFEFTKDGKAKDAETEDLEEPLIFNDEIVGFLYKNWEKLMSGDSLNIRYPVPFRQETVGFKFFKEKEEADAILVKMKPSSIVIAALVKPLIFKFKKDGDRRLLSVDGRTTPKKKNKDKWEDLDAVFELKF